ncbi:MAG: hypothetical protein Q3988_02815 [Gemella sp.]|nr:hypothetical protein [Gemella sp.]
MKKFVLLSSMGLFLTACSQQTVTPQKQDINVNVNVDMSAAAKVENANNGATPPNNNSGNNNAPISGGSVLGTLSPMQSERLAKGMVDFGRNMGQSPYIKTDVPTSLTWQTGGAVVGYTIYESYIYQSGGTTHRYFFVTNPSGGTEVLYSTGGTSVKPTANADIGGIFANAYGNSGAASAPAPVAAPTGTSSIRIGELSSAQLARLADGMENFGKNMNQYPYVKTGLGGDLTWQSGGSLSGYTIYESYVYQSGGTTHRYFFVTNASGVPEVLYSTGGLSVRKTSNQAIVEMFSKVYRG